MLALVFAGCSAASGGSGDPELRQKLKTLEAENAKLGKQVSAFGSRSFDRASRAEKKRRLKGASRVLHAAGESLRFDALVLGPLKFKKKTRSFLLDIGAGKTRRGIEDHKAGLRGKGGK